MSAADDIKGLAAELRQEGKLLGRQPELGDAFLLGTGIFKAADALEALSAKLDAAREVIRPFAEAADDLDPDHGVHDIWETPCAMSITGNNLRAAARWMEDE